MNDLTRLLLTCDDNPEDLLAWETLSHRLERRGFTGPLAKLAKDRVANIHWDAAKRKRIEEAVEAWKPLIDRGFILFTVWRQGGNFGSVFHIARLRLQGESQMSREAYPDGWQRGQVNALCNASPGVVYRGGAWTDRRTPSLGHEHRPCKTCLERLGGRRTGFWDDGDDGLTQEELYKLWTLRNRD